MQRNTFFSEEKKFSLINYSFFAHLLIFCAGKGVFRVAYVLKQLFFVVRYISFLWSGDIENMYIYSSVNPNFSKTGRSVSEASRIR